MAEKTMEQLFNSIQERDDDLEYKTVPPGMQVMGLVKAKNVEQYNQFKDTKEPAIRLTFRSVTEPAGFINHTMTAKLSKKSNLFKTLQSMSDYAFVLEEGKNNSEKAFYFIQGAVNKWWRVAVVHKQANNGKTYANVADCRISPAGKDAPSSLPDQYFKNSERARQDKQLEEEGIRLSELPNAVAAANSVEDDDLDSIPF